MGHSFHRKKSILINRTKTNGTGYKYSEPVQPVVRELTEEDIAARAALAKQQAELLERREIQQQNVEGHFANASNILRVWQQAADLSTRLLVSFPGWTKADLCTLDVDKTIARFYVRQIQLYRERAEHPLTVPMLDRIIEVGCKRQVPTAETVEEATKIVRRTLEECTDSLGLDVYQFVELLRRRAARAKQRSLDLNSALMYVRQKFAKQFERPAKQ